MGSSEGKLAIIDLDTFGVVQRIDAPIEKIAVKAISFISPTAMLVLYANMKVSLLIQYKLYCNQRKNEEGEEKEKVEKKSDVKWVEQKRLVIKNRTVCSLHYEYKFNWK